MTEAVSRSVAGSGPGPGAGVAVRLVATLSVAYALSQFLRASPAVLAPELAVELRLSPEILGSLTGAFFFVFALAQMPLGVALDRWGPRRVMAVLAAFTVLGCVVFAGAESGAALVVGRALMGFGCAAMLMGPYVIYGREFPADRFAQLSSIQLGVGYLGALLATTPLAIRAEAWGWRTMFVISAGAAVAFAVLTLLVVRPSMGKAAVEPGRTHTVRDDLIGIVAVMRLRTLHSVLPLNMVTYGSVASILTLWGGPYLADIHGLTGAARGNILLGMMAASIAGLLVFGAIERRVPSRRVLILVGGGGNVVALVGLAFWPGAPLWLAAGFLWTSGFTNGMVVAISAMARRVLPPPLMGRGLTFMNMGMMMGVALMQVLLGWVAGLGTEPRDVGSDSPLGAAVYGRLFWVLAGLLLAALVWFAWRTRDHHATAQG